MIKMILKEYRWLLLLSSVFSALSAIAGILLISYINTEVSLLDGDSIRTSELMSRVGAFVGGLLGMVLLGTLSHLLLAKLSTSVVAKLRSSIIRNVLGTDYQNIEAAGGHRLLATMTSDVAAIAQSLIVLPTLMFNLTTVLLCLVYLAYLSLVHFGLLLLSLAVLVVGAHFVMSRARVYFKQLREQEDALFNSFKTLVDGGKELSLNLQRKSWFYHNRVTPNIEQIKETEFNAQVLLSINNNWTNLTIFGLMGLVVYAFNAILPTTIEVIVGYIFVIFYFVGPLTFVVSAFQPIFRGIVAYNKVLSLKLTDDSNFKLPQPGDMPPVTDWQQLVLKDVEYHYPLTQEQEQQKEQEKGQASAQEQDDVFGIGPINMTIKKGELIYLTGGNGSGKSTFAKLVTGLYSADKGRIELDGQTIDSDKRDWYRNCFSTIFSDFFLFDQVLDKQGKMADDSAIKPMLEKLHLADKVTSKDGVLSNTQLSQGQRKRLALLLVYLEDSPICLFDEWAADQDPHFRHYFYMELLPELKQQGKTVLVISHDDRYFHLADRVMKFDSGLMTQIEVQAPMVFGEPTQAPVEA